MSDTILITASLRIERPIDIVREQYRDIDHHIRNNVHPDIHYQWEAAEPGQRKIRTTFRILGVAQFDVSLLEDTPDGSFVIRYLEGTNAGMILTHKFVPVGEGATEVQLEANAPATLARKILGPLFKIGARQVMKKALYEDKMDLEKGSFTPGKAAGNLDEILALLANVKGDAGKPIVAAACLVTASDATIDPAENDAIAAIALRLGVDKGWVEAQQAELSRLASTDGIAARAKQIGADLTSNGVVREGIVGAIVCALVSHGMALGELEALRAIAAGAGYADTNLGPLIEECDAALMQH